MNRLKTLAERVRRVTPPPEDDSELDKFYTWLIDHTTEPQKDTMAEAIAKEYRGESVPPELLAEVDATFSRLEAPYDAEYGKGKFALMMKEAANH